MRYQDWDVLLFPGDSRVPIQEYDTKCFVLDQDDRLPVAEHVVEMDQHRYESMTLLPLLTSFVASLERGSEFRVSIHNWARPQPSTILLSYMTPDETVLFEARVYIDGILVAQRCFQDGVWPEVIGDPGHSSLRRPLWPTDSVERGRARLRFPAFHKDILQQPHWEPGETVGRIKLVIAEGVQREPDPSAATGATFDKLRDVVAFSFQHAPQHILEYSGIAWPNTKLFRREAKRLFRPAPIGTRLPAVPGHEVHAHSPQRPPVTGCARKAESGSGFDSFRFQRVLNAQTFSDLESDPMSKPSPFALGKTRTPHGRGRDDDALQSHGDDPFLGPPPRHLRLQLRTGSHDLAMPDYTSSQTDHSGRYTEMSGVSFQKANFLKQMNEAHPREIVQALTPDRQAELLQALSASRSPGRGTHAPTNTPRSVSGQSHAQPPTNTGDARPAEVPTTEELRELTNPGKAYTRMLCRSGCGEPSRARSCSESSVAGYAEDLATRERSPRCPGARPRHSISTGTRALSLSTHRPRSTSNASKRKRQSASPPPSQTKTAHERPHIMINSCSGSDDSGGAPGHTPPADTAFQNDASRVGPVS